MFIILIVTKHRMKYKTKRGGIMLKNFNLITNPWLEVIEETNRENLVSLQELFRNPTKYRRLAGDSASQDLAILRFLLSILTTVYSRVDAENQAYDWLELDENFQVTGIEELPEQEELQEIFSETWQALFTQKAFTKSVLDYLDAVKDKFEMFGLQPFYQVTIDDYNKLVDSKKKITEKSLKKRTGTVAVKQINRRISESNNTPAIFSPKSNLNKNELTLPELIRWIITYQNYTGVTDKTKVVSKDKFSTSPGWLYRLNPVYVMGDNLFETLMFNLILFENESMWSPLQKPVWEFESPKSYVECRLSQDVPNNIAELYTMWSRVLHIEWENNQPIIFSAGLPMPDVTNAFIEPMTIWRRDKKTEDSRPATKRIDQLGEVMWRNFGSYIRVDTTDTRNTHRIPGVIKQLEQIKNELGDKRIVTLTSSTLISDGNATSQAPVAEFVDNLSLNSAIIFDEKIKERWPSKIEDEIELVQQLVMEDYKYLLTKIAELRGISDSKEFEKTLIAKLYQRIDRPFREWMLSLKSDEDRDKKQSKWREQLRKIVLLAIDVDIEKTAGPRDFRGISVTNSKSGKQEQKNIFVYISWFKMRMNKILNENT